MSKRSRVKKGLRSALGGIIGKAPASERSSEKPSTATVTAGEVQQDTADCLSATASNGNLASTASAPEEQFDGVTDAQQGETSIPPSDSHVSKPSLWDMAYDALKGDDENLDLIPEYEDLLSRALLKGSLPSDEGQDANHVPNQIPQDFGARQKKLEQITELGLKHMRDKKLRFTLLGHEVVVQDQVANAVAVVEWAEGLITNAVKDLPYASTAWAGVSLILPLLKNPTLVDAAHYEGFTYVTSQMRYYLAMESLLLPEAMAPNLRVDLSGHLMDLYKLIIRFQVQSVIRFYRQRTKNFFRDTFNYDGWDDKSSEIKNCAAELVEMFRTAMTGMNMATCTESLRELKAIGTEAEASRRNLDEILSTMKMSLGVQREGVDAQREGNAAAQKTLEALQDLAKKQMTKEEQKCHALFRQINYEYYKNAVKGRLEGTCLWFLKHASYERRWARSETDVLIVSAEPGCGKSVLAKYLIDHELSRSATICYFFFKDSQQTPLKDALCSLLHQLFIHKSALIRHAMPEYMRNREKLPNADSSILWRILTNACRDAEAGEVILVLDALDECNGQSRDDPRSDRDILASLIHNTYYDGNRASGMRVVMTGRPYYSVTRGFQMLEERFPEIRIRGEDKLGTISVEIDVVVRHRVQEQALPDAVKEKLKEKLLAVPHRTYLWVYLIFDYLEKRNLTKTPRGITDAVHSIEAEDLPKSINDIYGRILQESETTGDVRRTLQIMLAAFRPLTLKELKSALYVSREETWMQDMQDEDDHDFQQRLRNLSSLISIYDGQVDFLHQTVKEFLVEADSAWLRDLSIRKAHEILADRCMIFLIGEGESLDSIDDSTMWKEFHQYPDFLYALEYWPDHIRELGAIPEALKYRYDALLRSRSPLCELWFRAWKTSHNVFIGPPGNLSDLAIRAVIGHLESVRALVENAEEMRGTGRYHPLATACQGRQFNVATYLASRLGQTQIESIPGLASSLVEGFDSHSMLPQFLRELSQKGLNINGHNEIGYTALHLTQNENTALMLCKLRANVDTISSSGMTPIHPFLQKKAGVVRILLLHGANAAAVGSDGLTALHTVDLDAEVATLLIKYGCPVDAKDHLGRTPLFYAQKRDTIMALVGEGADVNARDNSGGNYFHTAMTYRPEKWETLISLGVDLNAPNATGKTPLHTNGDYDVCEAFLKLGASVHARDQSGRTPVMCNKGTRRLLDLLVKHGADLNAIDKDGKTLLHIACEELSFRKMAEGADACLEAGAVVRGDHACDNYGNTPVHGLMNVPQALLRRSAMMPMSSRAVDILRATRSLLKAGVRASQPNKEESTALHVICGRMNEEGMDDLFIKAAMGLLLKHGASMEVKDAQGRTPLDICTDSYSRRRLSRYAELIREKGEGDLAREWERA